MTSDAKIGLLLGLVFIFVIAFIINGLPNLRPQTSKGEMTTTMAPGDFGIVDKAQKAQETYDWTGALEPQGAASDTTAAEDLKPMLEQPQTANNQGVRSIFPLPSIENLLEHLTPAVQQKEQVTTVTMDVPRLPAEQPVVTRQPLAVAPQPKPELTAPQPVVRTAETREASRPTGPPAASNKPAGKTYVVADGESLASVAKKVYGPEEGNRMVNIQRIFEANRDILKSVNEVRAGQKLVIPPLPQASARKDTPADVLPKTLFEKVDTIRKQAQANVPPKATEGRWYIVQDGDNLWKIAAGQLGSGARFEEIAKLNTDILKDNAKLDVGMKIRLPAK